MAARVLRVNGEVCALEAVDDSHYVVDGLAMVIGPDDLCLDYGERRYRVTHEQLSRGRREDTITIRLGDDLSLDMSGVYTVDEHLVCRLERTELHGLVKNRIGCLTVGALKMRHVPSAQAQTGPNSSYATARSGTPQPNVP